ncbi:MAG: hypothetical protein ACTSVZ_06840 [Promethearchaeota archaeon]
MNSTFLSLHSTSDYISKSKWKSLIREPEIISSREFYPFPHIVLHGNPLHAIIAYIDADLKVRALESSPSIEILREGATFNSLLQKWSNPF